MTLKEAKEIVLNNGLRFKKHINEEVKTFTNKAQVFKEITNLSTSAQFVEKFLLALYNRQENDEKSNRVTVHKNYRGFNQADAGILSNLAEQFIETHSLTPMQYNLVRNLIKKYHKQTLNIFLELGNIQIEGKLYRFDTELYTEHQLLQNIESIAFEMLDDIEEITLPEFKQLVINAAEADGGALGVDEKKLANDIATEMFYTGASIQATADRINEEI